MGSEVTRAAEMAAHGVTPEIEARCLRVLSCAFRGMHHIDGWLRRKPLWRGIEVSTHQSLATFDFDLLTRLVVAAHDEAVRVEIAPSGPRLLKIQLWPRERTGSMLRRHPNIEEAIECARK